MKTIKIKKTYSSGSKLLYVIVPENCSESIIKQYVEIECDKDLQKCQDAQITGTPTWIINNKQIEGTQTIKKLKELTGC